MTALEPGHQRYLDGDGELWDLREQLRFGRDGARLFTSAAVMVRRADRAGGVIVSAPADWQNDAEMARVVWEAKRALAKAEAE